MSDFEVYRDGEEIRLNIVDANTSVLITFTNNEQFLKFTKKVEKAKKTLLREEEE